MGTHTCKLVNIVDLDAFLDELARSAPPPDGAGDVAPTKLTKREDPQNGPTVNKDESICSSAPRSKKEGESISLYASQNLKASAKKKPERQMVSEETAYIEVIINTNPQQKRQL